MQLGFVSAILADLSLEEVLAYAEAEKFSSGCRSKPEEFSGQRLLMFTRLRWRSVRSGAIPRYSAYTIEARS